MLWGISYLDNPDFSFHTKSLLARQKYHRSRQNHYYRHHRFQYPPRFLSRVSLQAAHDAWEEPRLCLSKWKQLQQDENQILRGRARNRLCRAPTEHSTKFSYSLRSPFIPAFLRRCISAAYFFLYASAFRRLSAKRFAFDRSRSLTVLTRCLSTSSN